MNIKLLVSPGFHGYGHGCRAPRLKLTRCILLVGTCEKSHSETLPAHLGSVLGVMTPSIWEWWLGVNVHTSAELKLIYQPCSRTRAAHTLTRWANWTHMVTWRWILGEVATSCLARWLSRVIWGCYPMSLLEVATFVLIIIMMMINNLVISTPP
jgi:hypothetical protein